MPIHRSLATDPGPAPLRRLADQIETLRHEDRPPAILRACLELGGTVSRPGDGTHFFEIMLLGAYARGADLVEAARNWLAVARNIAPLEPAPPSAGDPPLARDLELARALGVLARTQDYDDDRLRSACRSVLNLSRDWPANNIARLLLQALDRAPRAEA